MSAGVPACPIAEPWASLWWAVQTVNAPGGNQRSARARCQSRVTSAGNGLEAAGGLPRAPETVRDHSAPRGADAKFIGSRYGQPWSRRPRYDKKHLSGVPNPSGNTARVANPPGDIGL